MAPHTDERIDLFRREYLPILVAGFKPALVMAFGSRARGEALAHSDLDLLIVSASFQGVKWLDRPVRVIEALGLDFGVDVLCYTPEEFAQKREELGIVRTATEEGMILLGELAPSDAGAELRG
ncbi:MAG: nucleotidyltransferase domain-containing protein [Nitrospirae bacterium]|nr:nucleotidyltransferase domain-containing protein [Nitrospirota bacterium]